MAVAAKDLDCWNHWRRAQHPFDTIEVKLQSQPAPLPGQLPKYSGAVDAVKQTIASEGPRGLYQGMEAPLPTVASLQCSSLYCEGRTNPTELTKCRLQARSATAESAASSGAVNYGGPMDVAKDVFKSEGGLRGLHEGLCSNPGTREVPGNDAVFGAHEALKQYFAGGKDTSGLGRGSLIVAGGLAGASLWLSGYPSH